MAKINDERERIDRDIRGRAIFLGTGTSHGVPMIGCGCPVCRSDDPRNQRTRASIIFGLPEGNLLIDTGPELRMQLIRERIGLVHAVAYTHDHSDHLMGLDDLRIFSLYLDRDIPVYCSEQVEHRILTAFDYVFDPKVQAFPAGGIPKLQLHRLVPLRPFDLLGARITPIPLLHGPFEILGFRVGNVAYCTDTSGIPPESEPLLRDLDLLILDALRYRPHPTHFNLEQACEAALRLGARRTLFTHLCHDLDHTTVCEETPEGIEPAHDGLVVELS